jgi:CRP-like cAMP-binding protein
VKPIIIGDRVFDNPRMQIDNRLLAALPGEDYQRLARHSEPVALAPGEVLYESGERVGYVYFLNKNTLVSLVSTMEGGMSVEAGVVGNEGMIGIQAFMRTETTPHRSVVQLAGSALKMRADVLREEFNRGGALQDLLLRYTHALLTEISRTASCNHLHTVEERLSRWLLVIHDRVSADHLPLTQEMISRRLGAHRSSVSEVADTLRRKGLLRYSRGKITIPNREALKSMTCECYNIIKEEFDRVLAV